MRDVTNDESIDDVLERLAVESGDVPRAPDQGSIPVGGHIHSIRAERGMSLQQLAEKTGFSAAVLSQVENRMTSPPLGMLVKIANVFDTSVSALIGGREEAAFSIVRKADRRTVSRVELKGGGKAEYSYEALGTGKAGRRMEPFLVTLSPISDANVPRSVHDGEEFLFVLSGRVEIFLGDFADVLE
ncbi:MAG TPA: XRE family transcriptional regulator, partial [Candidatus Deferrimicrobiaceae bacterium]